MQDARYFAVVRGHPHDAARRLALEETMLAAYRWQYILSGAAQPHFVALLERLLPPNDRARIEAALASLQT